MSLALIMRDVLLRTNALVGQERFLVSLVARHPLQTIGFGPVSVRVSPPRRSFDDVLVPPLATGKDPFAARRGEARAIVRWHERGAAIHCACLGSLIVAQTGLLDGREATTHWAWIASARRQYPGVKWDATRMICDTGDVVSAGGFLAAVDLTLALVERVCSRAVSHEVGRLLLVDSVRQHQSVYATTLVPRHADEPWTHRLSNWIDTNLTGVITVKDMAAACHLSTRTFHRLFARAFGVSPRKLLQLKRIERVRLILRDANVSVEEAIQKVGVSDVPSFRKVFRRELGLSPAEFRRRLRSG